MYAIALVRISYMWFEQYDFSSHFTSFEEACCIGTRNVNRLHYTTPMYQTTNTTMSLLFSTCYNFNNGTFSLEIGNSVNLAYECVIIIKECNRENYDGKYLLFEYADFLKLITLGAPPGFCENKSDESSANIGTYSINVQCNTISFTRRLEIYANEGNGNFYLESAPYFMIPLVIWKEIQMQAISINYRIKVNEQYRWYLQRSHSKIAKYYFRKLTNKESICIFLELSLIHISEPTRPY